MVDKPVYVVLTTSRFRWHEIGLFVTQMALFLVYVFGPTVPSLKVTGTLFIMMGALGGVVGLMGVLGFDGRHDIKLKFEQAGLLFIAAAGSVLGVAQLNLYGGRALLSIIPVFGIWVGGSLGRAIQIVFEIRRINAELAEQAKAHKRQEQA